MPEEKLLKIEIVCPACGEHTFIGIDLSQFTDAFVLKRPISIWERVKKDRTGKGAREASG